MFRGPSKPKACSTLPIQWKFDDLSERNFRIGYTNWKEKLAIKRAYKALAAAQPK